MQKTDRVSRIYTLITGIITSYPFTKYRHNYRANPLSPIKSEGYFCQALNSLNYPELLNASKIRLRFNDR